MNRFAGLAAGNKLMGAVWPSKSLYELTLGFYTGEKRQRTFLIKWKKKKKCTNIHFEVSKRKKSLWAFKELVCLVPWGSFVGWWGLLLCSHVNSISFASMLLVKLKNLHLCGSLNARVRKGDAFVHVRLRQGMASHNIHNSGWLWCIIRSAFAFYPHSLLIFITGTYCEPPLWTSFILSNCDQIQKHEQGHNIWKHVSKLCFNES